MDDENENDQGEDNDDQGAKDIALFAERTREIMALLDAVNAAVAALATDATDAAGRVSTDLAAAAQRASDADAARDAALAQVGDLQTQIAALQADAVSQADIDALLAAVAAVAAAVQAIDAPAPVPVP